MNVYKLEASIGLNSTEYQKGLKAAGESMSAMGDKIKSGAEKIAKVSTATFGAAAAGVSALVKQSISAYADYEQLAGGIETLFGDAASKVMKDAEQAYKTAGLSANDYMETSIQSAAALINSLDGDQQKAADLMNMSIVDMADNVNKMGTSMEGVQNAYRGFSRGNFTMLDNLALGFAGTKEGMQELLDKAKELSGVAYDINSYADIVEAIHVVQSEMGITGTTAKEASETISGSIASLKASWKNLAVEMSREDGDVNGAFKAIGENVGTVIDNIMPRVEQAIGGVGDLITTAAPEIAQAVSNLLPKILPSLMKSAASLTGAVGKALIKAAPELLSATSSMMKELWSNFANSDLGVFDWIKEDAVKVVESVKGIFKNINFEAIKESFHKVGTAFNNAFSMIGDGIAWVSENVIAPLVEWGANEVLPKVFDSLAASVEILTSAFEFLKEPLSNVWEFLKPLAEGAGIVISGGLDLIADSLTSIANELEDVDWSGFWDDISNGEFFADWKRGADGIAEWFDTHGKDIDEFFGSSGFGSKWNEFWQKVGAEAQETQEMWKDCFTIIGHYLGEFVRAWETGAKEITDAIDSIKKKYKEFKELWGAGADTIKESSQKTVGGLAFSYLKSKLPGFAEGGRVTRPTIALVGEKEPETIIPDSKRGEFGTTNYNTFNISIDGTGKNAEEIADEAIEVISTKLDILGIQQQRAVGGKSWA
jgi:hypothetical protein